MGFHSQECSNLISVWGSFLTSVLEVIKPDLSCFWTIFFRINLGLEVLFDLIQPPQMNFTV